MLIINANFQMHIAVWLTEFEIKEIVNHRAYDDGGAYGRIALFVVICFVCLIA